MTGGWLRIGSPAPVHGLPAWVTPVVVRGGFATGQAAAGAPLAVDERELATSLGLPSTRAALFRHHLNEAGLHRLWTLLDDRGYSVHIPEEATLLTVAWLVRAGDHGSAVELVEEVERFAPRLRFLPCPRTAPLPAPGTVARQTVQQAAQALRGRREQPQIAAQREAVTVWAPFADRLLEHWCVTRIDGRVGGTYPQGWLEAGATLLGEYGDLARRHTLSARHKNPKENLSILRACLQSLVDRRPLRTREQGLLQHAVDSMVRKRGEPGSERLEFSRALQQSDVDGPSHTLLAEVVAGRLDAMAPSAWLTDVAPVLGPVAASESILAAGAPLPTSFTPIVRRARASTVEDLIADGTVPSAEVLAELAPLLTATVVAEAFPDPQLRDLVAEVYRAFSARRSLLLTSLEPQVRPDELPWLRAVAGHATDPVDGGEGAMRALSRLAGLAISTWPGTLLPNALIVELQALARAAGRTLPLTEELAADIFTGSFTPKYVAAARTATTLLDGSLYARYYRLPRAGDRVLTEPASPGAAAEFAGSCRARAGVARKTWGVAANGAVIEQAQVLTTHNLAVLVADVGVRPSQGWRPLADGAARRCVARLDLARRSSRPLRAVKDAAYAWRQAVFYLSMDGQSADPASFRGVGKGLGPDTSRQWTRLLDGLDEPGSSAPFYGWNTWRPPPAAAVASTEAPRGPPHHLWTRACSHPSPQRHGHGHSRDPGARRTPPGLRDFPAVARPSRAAASPYPGAPGRVMYPRYQAAGSTPRCRAGSARPGRGPR